MLVLGGINGQIVAYDIMSRSQVAINCEAHIAEILKIFFFDDQCQMITCSKDRQVCLWDANKFECIQTIKDLNFSPNYYSQICFFENLRQIIVGTFKVKFFKLRPNEKIEIQSLQTNILLDQSKDIMQDKIYEEASKHLHTSEGAIIYNQIQNEKLKVKDKMRSFMSSVLSSNLINLEQEKIKSSHKTCADRLHVNDEI